MAILLRTDKGSKLTYIEADENFSSLFYSASISGNTLSLYYTGSSFAPSTNPVNIDIPQGSSYWTASLSGRLTRVSDVGITGNLQVIGQVTGSVLKLASLPVGTTETRILVADGSGNVKYRTDLQLQGVQGIQGYTGAQGIQGIQGAQGIQGIQGIQGVEGLEGAQGIQGIQGTQGPQGTQGVQGIQGIQGTQGIQGIQGLQGLQGNQGTQGIQGISIQGIQGIQGVQGTQGIQGIQGFKGDTGLAFTIAKTYISVAALTADTSPTGITSGQFAIIDTGNANDVDNSKIYLWNGTSYTFINDLSGAAGIQGIQGIQGTSVQGIQGIQGIQGTQGTQGIQGISVQGIQGIQGIQGNGIQGIQGIQGITGGGTQGIQGIQGLQGNTGTGTQGATGLQGPQGTTGDTGPTYSLQSTSTGDWYVLLGDSSLTPGQTYPYFDASSTGFKFNAGTHALTVQGSVTAAGFFNSSDRRLKSITRRDGDVAYYKWLDGRDDKEHIGYIAQEQQQTYPDQIATDGEFLTVNYTEILVAKVRELEKEIELLKSRL